MKQGIRLLTVVSISMVLFACGHAEQDRQQAESERVAQEYKKQLEAQETATTSTSDSTFVIPPAGPVVPEPVLTVAAVMAMTNPDTVTKALTSSNTDVRLAAVNRLGVLAVQHPITDASLQSLINVLDSDSDDKVAAAAAQALGKTCHPAAMVRLLNNLKRSPSDVNAEAVAVLGDVAGYSATQALDEFVTSLEDDHSALATSLQTQAEQAKAKILSRNGRPVNCAW